jgi:hypothetical protein
MGSVSQSVDAAKRSEYTNQDDSEVSKAARLLIARHGEDAATMAARRADALFREGNASEGALWLAIFRKIALTHPSGTP